MSLSDCLSNFNTPIVRICAGRKILDENIRPLLLASSNYCKISSFFTPSVISSILLELEQCFRKKKGVRLIIGIHDSDKLIPVLDLVETADRKEKFKLAVSKIITDGIQECISLSTNPYDFFLVLSELIRQEFIQIKIASVKVDYLTYLNNGTWPQNDSTFHPKISIFKDREHTVVMSGSINSTKKGYGDNVEEACFTGSWFLPDVVSSYEGVFEEIWNGNHLDSQTFDFNVEIRDLIKKVTENSGIYNHKGSQRRNSFSTQQLLKLIDNSPLFFHWSFKNVRLLPHQRAIYRALLSRWPIVGLIADEVGLGKTIEAGAVISYLQKFFRLNKIALLVPSSLRNQWQTELYNLFGLEFYIYDSSSKCLVFTPNNEFISSVENVTPDNYYAHGITNIIFSWHYLRSNGFENSMLQNSDIDLVVVDEAHGARLYDIDDVEGSSTQLYQLLEQLFPSVKHKILLTATPFQTNPLDYVALMRLLMANKEMTEASLERIARLNAGKSLLTQQKVDGMFELINNTPYPIDGITDVDTSDLSAVLTLYSDKIYLKNHPTTIYTLRNTRNELKSIGYRFPEIRLDSHSIELSKKQLEIFRLVEDYIENQLFSIESSLGGRGLGFIRTIYHQRIVSSFKACYDTLLARLQKLRSIINTGVIGDEYLDNSEDDYLTETLIISNRAPLSNSEIAIATTESEYIEEILCRIQNRLEAEDNFLDPKIERAILLTRSHLDYGDKVILFSRFTSTTDFIVNKMIEINEYPFGRYQGNIKQFIKNHKVVNVDRPTISKMFNNGDFPVIVCSDAASEGLNLQSANVIINVDVPWNPARLLQRFGRIDRFGQKKDKLFFYNLFYPGTIEDRMYSRLHQRNNEFRELLGATPEITSAEHIRDLQLREITPIENGEVPLYKNSLIKLTKGDNIRIHEQILSRIDCIQDVFRDSTTINYLGKLFRYSLDEFESDYLDLNHPIFNHLKSKEVTDPTALYELRNRHSHLLVYCVVNHEVVFPIISLEELLDYLLLGKPLSRGATDAHFTKGSLEDSFIQMLTDSEQLINHKLIQFNSEYCDFYEDLELIQTDIEIDCIFKDGENI